MMRNMKGSMSKAMVILFSVCLTISSFLVLNVNTAEAEAAAASEVVIDSSTTPNANSADVGYYESNTGPWYTSTNTTALHPYNNQFSRYTDGAGAYAVWRPALEAGKYRVYFWTMIHESADPDVAVEIIHANGLAEQHVNLQAGTSGWVDLGVYSFNQGNAGYVKATRSSKYLRTSAVKFVPTTDPAPDSGGSSNAAGLASLEQTKTLYVSPDGNDAAAGTIDQPLKTVTEARDIIRTYKSQNGGVLTGNGLTVYLKDGIYPVDNTISFGSYDSGTADCPITYKALNSGKAHLVGGVDLDPSQFAPVTDPQVLNRISPAAQGKVLQVQLPQDYQLDPMNPQPYGVDPAYMPEELLFNGTSLKLARYPNGTSYASVTPGSTATRVGSSERYNVVIKYSDSEIDRLVNHTKDVMVLGYWAADWAIDTVNIGTIDTVNKTFTPPQPVSLWSSGTVWSNARFYVYNSLELLDTPGEWYVDRDTKILYLYPPSAMSANTSVQLSKLKDSMVKFTGSSYVNLKGIAFESSRGFGVYMANTDHVVISGSTFRNLGKDGVRIDGGTYNGVESSDLYDLGWGGVIISEGSDGSFRQNLTPQHNFAVNNNIYRYARILKNYHAGVDIRGTGNYAAYNEIHNAPHVAIIFGGNNHVIEYNNIYNVVQESSDAGAIYAGRDFTQQGMIIRYNYIHHINPGPGITGGTIGVYLDDMLSGINVYGNLFDTVAFPTFFGGGWMNRFTNNIIVKGSNMPFSLHIDQRGIGSTSDWFQGSRQTMINRLNASPYKTPIWQNAFPDLYALGTQFDIVNNPTVDINNPIWAPMYNVVKNNVLINDAPQPDISDPARNSVKNAGDIEGSTARLEDPGFAASKTLDHTAAVQAVIDSGKLGDISIDFAQIGNHLDEYRTVPSYRDGIYQKLGFQTNNVLTDGSNWQPSAAGASSYANGKMVLQPATYSASGNDGMLTYLTPQPANNISKVKVKMNLENGPVGIVLKAAHPNVGPWNGNDSYVAVFSKTIIEIQKWMGSEKKVLASMPNTVTVNDAWQNIEFGTPTLSTSVNIILKVAGAPLLDIMDANSPILQPGYFSVYNYSGADLSLGTDAYQEIVRTDINLGGFIADQANWVYKPDSVLFNSETGEMTLVKPSAGVNAGYTGAMLKNDVLHFRIKSDWPLTDTSMFGLATGVSDVNKFMWEGNVGYCLFIKKHQVELHKYTTGGHEQLLTLPTTIFAHDDNSTTDNWHDVAFGTEQTVDGVTVILDVDGQSLIRYSDETKPYRGSGYFQVSNFSADHSIILAPANELASVTMSVYKTTLLPAETASLSLNGVMSDGSPADLSKAQVSYSSDNTGVATVDQYGIVTAVGAGDATIKAIVSLSGVTKEQSIAIKVTDATIDLNTLRDLVAGFIDTGELSGPLVKQLINALDQAQHQLDKERPEQAAKHLEDFVKLLNNTALEEHVSTDAKAALNAAAQALIQLWEKK